MSSSVSMKSVGRICVFAVLFATVVSGQESRHLLFDELLAHSRLFCQLALRARNALPLPRCVSESTASEGAAERQEQTVPPSPPRRSRALRKSERESSWTRADPSMSLSSLNAPLEPWQPSMRVPTPESNAPELEAAADLRSPTLSHGRVPSPRLLLSCSWM